MSKVDKWSIVDPFLYKKFVGRLIYLIATIPNIMYGVSLISMFMESPKDFHWKVGKRITRYIEGTIDFGIWYSASNNNSLFDYTDVEFPGSVDDRKSTSCYASHLGTSLV